VCSKIRPLNVHFAYPCLPGFAVLISRIFQGFDLRMAVTALAESVCLLGEGEGCACVPGSLMAVG
jgi:hypothetical protein